MKIAALRMDAQDDEKTEVEVEDGKLHYTLAALAPSLFEDGGVAVGGF